MALQFTPIAFGVMLMVAVGTLAYSLWNSPRQPQQVYSSSAKTFDVGYDTHTFKKNDDGLRDKKRKRKEEKPKCSICLDTLKANLETLPCSHIFHKHCITMWFSSNGSNSCPNCRKVL